MLCVRNTHLETIQAGKTPVTITADWSDLTLVEADRDVTLWTEVSHISDEGIQDLIGDVANRLCAAQFWVENNRAPNSRK